MRCVLLLQEARPAFGRPERELHIDRCACIPRFSVHWPTHGRLSRLLGRLAHARHGHTAVRCARVAHELRAGPIRPTARSMRAAQVPAARCSRAQLHTHGRLSRLLGRPIHARRAGDAVRCVRVAQELHAATRAASVRAQHGVQKVGEASTTPWRAAPTERGPTERGPTWTASSGRLSRGRGRAVAADCRRPSRRASDMPPARGREEGADCGSGSVALVVLSRRVCVGTFISLPRTRVERVAGNALLRALRRQSAEGPSAAGRVGPASIGPDLERAGPSPAVGTYTATRSYPLVNSLR